MSIFEMGHLKGNKIVANISVGVNILTFYK